MDVDLGVKNLFSQSVCQSIYCVLSWRWVVGDFDFCNVCFFFFFNDDHTWLLQRLSNDDILKILSR